MTCKQIQHVLTFYKHDKVNEIITINFSISNIFVSLKQSSFRKKVSLKKVKISQPAITCSKLTIETLEQGVKYVQS